MNTDSEAHKVIGGLFGFQRSEQRFGQMPPFIRNLDRTIFLNLARTGIHYLVISLKPSYIWMPSYLCGTMIEPIIGWREKIKFYPVDRFLNYSDLEWIEKVNKDDLVCIIDYFGYPTPIFVKEALYNRGAIILEDACQAMLTEGIGSLADFIIFSPRKFIGLPDGGVLESLTDHHTETMDLQETPANWWLKMFYACLLRYKFDLQGSDGEDRLWFELYRDAERSVPKGIYQISSLSKALLFQGFDYSTLAKARRENYQILHQKLTSISLLPFPDSNIVPLGFVIRLKDKHQRDILRKYLFDLNIYPPVHWQIHHIVPHNFQDSHELSDKIMTIPCDQRYNAQDMERVADTICNKLSL